MANSTCRFITHGRILLGAVAAAVITLSLSGCVPIAGDVAEQSGHASIEQARRAMLDTGEARVGDCWRGGYVNVQSFDWTGGSPVSCASTHEFYTYAVEQLHSKYTGSEFDSSHQVKPGLIVPAEDMCRTAQEDDFGVFGPREERLRYMTFLPTTEQWARGARWVRCDFNVFAIGSPLASPRLAALPSISVLTKRIEYKSVIYNFCVNVPGGDVTQGPRVYNAVFASCSDDPEWVYAGTFSIPFPNSSSPYPAAATFAKLYGDICRGQYADATHTTFPVYPTRSDWQLGNYHAECWIHTD